MAMDIRLLPTDLDGVLLIEPECFVDERGFFMESYSQRAWTKHGLNLSFVQDNHSRSSAHVLRGFHYQDATAPQVRVVRCTRGAILDVVVDIRVGSPTFGRHVAEELTAENRRQLIMDPGFAHGFLVLTDIAEVQYKCTHCHEKSAERTLAYNDPEVAIPWPEKVPVLSVRDTTQGESLRQYLQRPAFKWGELDVLPRLPREAAATR